MPAYITSLGAAHHGDALAFLGTLPAGRAALVLTSPPFALRRQKAYGNVAAADYVAWFMPIAAQIHRVLRHDGSFVMELGMAWEAGGTRSLFPFRLLLELGNLFHLAQDFYWNNPSRLPGPAEWVTIQRTRVKESVTLIWWLSKSRRPRADNRQVLAAYSPSMQRLLRDGYAEADRPSQHKIGPHFQRDNGGAIPSNLLTVANTRGTDVFPKRCRAAGLAVHPARMPPELPEFFIKLLTTAGQLVVDPFAGSNTTGQVAEQLGRKWLSVEVDAGYVKASRLRFQE